MPGSAEDYGIWKKKNSDWFGLVSMFNGISTFVGYLMPKAILLEEQ